MTSCSMETAMTEEVPSVTVSAMKASVMVVAKDSPSYDVYDPARFFYYCQTLQTKD